MEKIYKLIKTYEDACLILNKDDIDNYIIDSYTTDGIKLETIAEAIRGKSSIFDCEGDRSYNVSFQFCTEEFAKELDIFKFPDKYIILKDNPQGFKYLFRYISDEPRISISTDSPFAQDTYEKAEHLASNFTELWLDYIGKRKFEKYVNDKEIIDSIFNKEPEHKRLYTLEYNLGDPSDDGHGKCERHFAKSNYSPKEISKAYKSATELLGFDFVKEIAAKYTDSSISCKYTGKLLKHGILTPSDFGYSDEEWKEYLDDILEDGESLNYEDLNKDFYDLDQDKFVDIFVKIIKLILPDFELTEIITPTDEYLGELEGAGYGLFM